MTAQKFWWMKYNILVYGHSHSFSIWEGIITWIYRDYDEENKNMEPSTPDMKENDNDTDYQSEI